MTHVIEGYDEKSKFQERHEIVICIDVEEKQRLIESLQKEESVVLKTDNYEIDISITD